MLKRNEDAISSGAWCSLNRPNEAPEHADVVIFGIPYDKGVSYRSGASEAPRLLRHNTFTSTPFTERLQSMEDMKVYDLGDFEGERDIIFQEIQTQVEQLVRRGQKFTMIGGDHSVTIPVQRGVDAALDEEFGIIHIDAHLDMCEALYGDGLSHGSTERRATELENIPDSEALYFIGIRSIEPDEYDFMCKNKMNIKTAYDCYHEGMEAVASDCVQKMKRFKKVYLTFDIDALDPAYAAGTGTPQFGGLTSRMALDLLERLFKELNIIGFDIVEVAPSLDPALTSMFAARKLLTEMWGYWMEKEGRLKGIPR